MIFRGGETEGFSEDAGEDAGNEDVKLDQSKAERENIADDVEMAIEKETVDDLDDVHEIAGHANRFLLHDLLCLLVRRSMETTVDCSHSTRYGQICLSPSSVCSW